MYFGMKIKFILNLSRTRLLTRSGKATSGGSTIYMKASRPYNSCCSTLPEASISGINVAATIFFPSIFQIQIFWRVFEPLKIPSILKAQFFALCRCFGICIKFFHEDSNTSNTLLYGAWPRFTLSFKIRLN